MPYRSPQIFLQPLDIDFGDSEWVETTERLLAYIRERMLSFEFSDHAEKIDELKIAFNNDDHEMCDMPTFVVGQKFLCAWGWEGDLCPPRRMIVAKRENGNPYVVWLRDPMVMLTQRKGYRHKGNATDSEFVREIAEEWGYTGPLARITETTARHEITQPKHRTDATQLYELAKRNGFEFYIDGAGLYWGPRQLDAEPIAEYIWRTDPNRGTILREPRIDQHTDRAAAQVIVEARDPLKKETFKVEVTASTADGTALGAEIEIDDPGDSPGTKRAKRASKINVRAAGYMTEEEARALAQAIYRDNVQGMYTLSLGVIGDPHITAKRIIQMLGHSRTFDGLYYVREVQHIIRAGSYQLEIKAERDALAEVRVQKKARRPVVNKNASKIPDKTASTDTATQVTPEGQKPLQRSLTVALNDAGQPVAAWIFVDGENEQNASTRELTPDELTELSDATLKTLAQQGVQSALPEV